MTHEADIVAALQASLLDRLDAVSEPDDAMELLRTIESESEMRQWIDSFDPHMAQLAAQLVQQWGVRQK